MKNITRIVFSAIAAMLLFFTQTNISAVKADTARTVEETQREMIFITFHKGYTEERRYYLGAAYFLPDEYYEEGYEYGAAIFPESFIERYDLRGDYLARKESDGLSINVLIGSGEKVENGRLITYSTNHFPAAGFDLRIAHVFFVKNAAGEISYREPAVTTYNETTEEFLTSEDLLRKAKERRNEIAMNKNFGKVSENVSALADSLWIYIVIACSSVVVIWGAYIGIKIAVAKKNEQKVDAKSMVKRFVIGIVVMFVLAVGLPLLIKGLAAWTGA